MSNIKHTLGSVAMEAACIELSPVVEPFPLRQALTDSKVEAAAYKDLVTLAGYLKSGKLPATHWHHGTPFDPLTDSESAIDQRWILSESERILALELLGLIVFEKLAAGTVANQQSPQACEVETQRIADRQEKMGYHLDEAAQEIANQQGQPTTWARNFYNQMVEAAALPAGEPLRLKVRHTSTGLVNPQGTIFSQIALVRNADVNEWLSANGQTFRWNLQRNELNAQNTQKNNTLKAPELETQSEVTKASAMDHTAKKWTNEKLEELRAFRANHTMPETAKHFGISMSRIRQLDPRKKQKKVSYKVLTHRMK